MSFNDKNINIDRIMIWDEVFTGIGWQGLMTVNTKTYPDEPVRSLDGSIPNIDDHDTFIVPRAKVNFKLFKLDDYRRLCNVINLANQFPVTYYDKEKDSFVTHYMYCEPEEMKKLFNIGTRMIGVLDYEISFIGTLNHLQTYNVTYHLNYNNDSSILSTTEIEWGRSTKIIDENKLVELANEKGYAIPQDKHLGLWNTRANGSGINYRPNLKPNIFSNLDLYAQWE